MAVPELKTYLILGTMEIIPETGPAVIVTHVEGVA